MTPALDEHTKEAVMRFLQSVMVIDDQATYPGAVRAAVRTLQEPDPEATHAARDDTPPEADGHAKDATTRPDALDAAKLIDAFAEMGLVCGIMRPESPEDLNERRTFLPAADRADIVILDWEMGDKGEHARRILKALSERTGLRLIAVYTFKSELDDIAKAIETEVDGKRDGFSITKGDFTVQIYAKDTATVAGEGATRIRSPAELADTLIEDFARLTHGIVPTAAVAAIGALRVGTPGVLALLGADLDPGLLGHRLLLSDPDDADRQLLDLIGAEMRTVADDDELVARATGIEALRAYVMDEMPAGPLPRDVVLRMLEIGTTRDEAVKELNDLPEVKSLRPTIGHRKAKRLSRTALVTGGDEEEARTADLLFGQRMLLRSDGQRPPVLQLGTILKQDDEWFVCVQPDCDGVRIDGSRPFPLAPAKRVVADGSAKLDLLIHYEEEDLGLVVDLHLYRVYMVSFPSQSSTRTVFAGGRLGGWTFSADDGTAYNYVAQLRRDHSHRLGQDFGTSGARIGLDESELIRRWGE